MIKKYFRGKIVKTDTGSVQFVRNNDVKKDFLLISGRHGDIYIPTKAIHKALEDEWIADNEDRNKRIDRAIQEDIEESFVKDL